MSLRRFCVNIAKRFFSPISPTCRPNSDAMRSMFDCLTFGRARGRFSPSPCGNCVCCVTAHTISNSASNAIPATAHFAEDRAKLDCSKLRKSVDQGAHAVSISTRLQTASHLLITLAATPVSQQHSGHRGQARGLQSPRSHRENRHKGFIDHQTAAMEPGKKT